MVLVLVLGSWVGWGGGGVLVGVVPSLVPVFAPSPESHGFPGPVHCICKFHTAEFYGLTNKICGPVYQRIRAFRWGLDRFADFQFVFPPISREAGVQFDSFG